jgi:glycosyltransferase involved in cell wall biosynthesis
LHDLLAARQLMAMAGSIDIVHAWPVGALHTLRAARRLNIPTVLERCNAHTRFAYDVVKSEGERLGVALPRNHEHAYNASILRREEAEYSAADRILCPSDFVVRTFVDQGVARTKLVRHIYGVDEKIFFSNARGNAGDAGLTMISVGVCAVRKGLHYALEAWTRSPASQTGQFLIAGSFLPAYQKRLQHLLAHPSVKILGHRNDVPELLRNADVLILPSIEEGFGLVCTEAMASGAVPVVSDACTDICQHEVNAMVHRVGDVEALTGHITKLHNDRNLLQRLRNAGLRQVPDFTWDSAGRLLRDIYTDVMAEWRAAPAR